MLIVYRSNRAELLAQLLAAQFQLSPPGPFEQALVVVNTWPTSRWLAEQLALHLGTAPQQGDGDEVYADGIAAHLRFPFPGSRLRQLVDELLGENAAPTASPSANDPWRATELVWPVLELLEELVREPEAALLRRWLERRQGERAEGGRSLGLPLWRLGRAIADAFDDYALYRPELLEHWWREGLGDGRGGELPEQQRWQPLLLRRLRDRLGVEPFGLRVRRAIEHLRRGTHAPLASDQPLRLFGLSSLAPVQVELLQALSGTVDVELYLLTPCRDLWRRCFSRRQQLLEGDGWRTPFAGDWVLEAPRLEGLFGRLGAEFQQLLEGTGEAQLGQWEGRDLFFLPAGVRAGLGHEPTVLEQLQQELVGPTEDPEGSGMGPPTDGGQGSLTLAVGDSSLEFHPCPGRLRQVQILRDRLLQLMAADPTLEPRDILVMTPQVETFAPLVASVFGDDAATGVTLPWRLTDRSQQSQAGLASALLGLLRLGGERLTATALEVVLGNGALLERFGLNVGEGARLTAQLQEAGFRWGLDGDDRGGERQHSLSWAIDRLLLGLVLPDQPGLALGDAAPLVVAGSLEAQGRSLQLLLDLRRWLLRLRQAHTPKRWGPLLLELLNDLFGEDGSQAWERQSILAASDDWLRSAGDTELALAAPVVAAVLEERLSIDSGRFGHRSGALTISALEPMRAIPHKVIVLLGLDAGVFPRRKERPGFHLLERQRRLGDPSSSDQDRYVLIEALLSARRHLLISWSNREERSGAELMPATPVRQLLETLNQRLAGGASALTIPHPANPLDRANFLAQPLRPAPSCDRRLLQARRLLERGEAHRPLPLALRQPPSALALDPTTAALLARDPTGDLRDWLMAPQKHWLRQLGLHPGEWHTPVEDLEDLTLDERQRAALLRGQLEERTSAAPQDGDGPDWLGLDRGRGRFPAGSAGELEGMVMGGRWRTLGAVLEGLGKPHTGVSCWQGLSLELDWRGQLVVLSHTAKEGVAQRLDLWLRVLLAAAAGEAPAGGVLVARSSKDQFAVELRLEPPEADQAVLELEALLALREQLGGACWPVPPRTGWAFVEAERKAAGSGPAKAAAAWEGGILFPGERESPVLATCFGADTPIDALLGGSFSAAAEALYGPVLERVSKERTRKQKPGKEKGR
ncbi:exodeoxyribonuclease V subunit gamma [Cyanobium sp. Morenito 9A2]|uniref:exodeoxyribonuclease V subunit gamma n=1 Tax=Cyanobium sp. Morenito 9A2 TaxID=2823718 RepID=UPI0020CEEAED|nr:exodeoxyribonuclease V subunit gamma [Cyanobium sp. Morenito 9A2]MCP9849005.1 exodeoxyribonuclease V subunit gamma [Cyanobium sp. Morenito 9A2]